MHYFTHQIYLITVAFEYVLINYNTVDYMCSVIITIVSTRPPNRDTSQQYVDCPLLGGVPVHVYIKNNGLLIIAHLNCMMIDLHSIVINKIVMT